MLEGSDVGWLVGVDALMAAGRAACSVSEPACRFRGAGALVLAEDGGPRLAEKRADMAE